MESRADRGSVTVEFALALPALVLVLALALASIGWVLGAARAQQAASEGARAAIVADDGVAIAVAQATSGGQAARIVRANGFITVCVAVPSRGLLGQGERCASARDQP